MGILRNRLLAIIMVFVLGFSSLVIDTNVSADNSGDTKDFVLNIDYDVLRKCGFQKLGTGLCACYCLAYCRSILDGKAHSKNEFRVPGTEYADWSSAGYKKKTYANTSKGTKKIWKKLYKSLSSGRPAIIYVSGSGSYGHYVTVVGYKNVKDIDKLSEKNFVFIDSMVTASVKDSSGKSRHVLQSLDEKYSLTSNGGYLEIVVTKDKGRSESVSSKNKGTLGLTGLKGICFKLSVPKTNISQCDICLLKNKYQYKGSGIKAGVKVKLGSRTLKKNKDYKVKYKHNKEIGNARIIIKGIGAYRGKVEMKFKIVPELIDREIIENEKEN